MGSLWLPVDQITQPTRRLIALDDGTTMWGVVPSLWRQAVSARFGKGGSEGPPGPIAERSLAAFELLDCMREMETVAARNLHRLNVPVPGDVPLRLRRLASTIIAKEPGDVDGWTVTFEGWVKRLSAELDAGDRILRRRLLRNSACPACKARQVTVKRDDGQRVVQPALVITWQDQSVRAAECQACAAAWWRGDDLYELAAQLGVRYAGI